MWAATSSSPVIELGVVADPLVALVDLDEVLLLRGRAERDVARAVVAERLGIGLPDLHARGHQLGHGGLEVVVAHDAAGDARTRRRPRRSCRRRARRCPCARDARRSRGRGRPRRSTSTDAEEGSSLICCLSRNSVAETDSIQIRSQRLGSPRATSPEQRSKTGMSVVEGNGSVAVGTAGRVASAAGGRRAAIQPDRARAGHARGGPQPAGPAREDRGDHPPHRGGGHQVRLLPAGLHHRPRHGQGRRLVVLRAGRREGLPARLRRHREPLHGPLRQLHRVRPGGVRAGRRWPTSTRSRCCPGIRASRACTATATTRRPASCWTPTRARTSSGSRTSSSRSSACSS